ncbi:Serine carboxypeptidase-like 3 [Acorus calamus]|uniref:Serine carboxypeptidase-like 3 n=1 Tax=Acorus calamus TaxID=4465 RepID=A0AAV9EJH2_ACOCL|nr:Serine carboxypeptidase-like 3 [Acorus calamus]
MELLWSTMKALLVLSTLFFSSASPSNVVKTLPGFDGPLPFELETGYIGVEEDSDVQIFYYFIKSERNAKEDPLLTWVSGGPYCSVLSGLAFGVGPLQFEIKEYKGELPTLISQPYSWTKWLEEHPQFKTNPLYIGGDSYSGLIAPVIAHELMKDMEDGRAKYLNLKSAKKRCRGQYLEPKNAQCADDVKAMQYSYGFMLSYYWANDKTVREALYIKKGTVKEWISGDHDMQLPHLATQAAIRSLNYSIIDQWRPFTVDGQVAG